MDLSEQTNTDMLPAACSGYIRSTAFSALSRCYRLCNVQVQSHLIMELE